MKDLLTRAVTNVTPLDLAKKKLASGKPIRIYLGIDPTGAKLHLGHSVPLRKLKAFQDAGHEVIFLVGSATAQIGDPTGKEVMREPLSLKQIKENFKDYKSQAGKILNFRKTKIVYNHTWFDKMENRKLMEIMSHFTVQQMLQRDMFQERMSWKVICRNCKEQFNSPIQFQSEEAFASATLKGNKAKCPHCNKMTDCNKDDIIPPPNPVNPTEFMYPIMQGYDSVMLDVDCEIGGNDQLFNMLCGRKLQKIYGKREKFVLTTKLIEGTDGRKMSKTYNNCIYLTDEPSDMFGKVMSIKDELMPLYFECCTDLSMDKIHNIFKGAARDAKIALAYEITSLYHGEKKAQSAREHFISVFTEKEDPKDIREVKVKKKTPLVDVLVDQGLVASKSEARRLIAQKGIKVNGKPVHSVDATVVETWTVKVGKKKFIRLKIT